MAGMVSPVMGHSRSGRTSNSAASVVLGLGASDPPAETGAAAEATG
eukprot:CAMPEP_0196680322 /NCGR_PEP_ID=MMETSP1090-20130531/7714_1 /TAXON_ID=37098 /ORGANISM="Isochrysis sp, Strain CCMP1244" /LENGTH=45 /DNA_ID= /DNA_START= /DNA_END= /DNA_ORIENTATION=